MYESIHHFLGLFGPDHLDIKIRVFIPFDCRRHQRYAERPNPNNGFGFIGFRILTRFFLSESRSYQSRSDQQANQSDTGYL